MEVEVEMELDKVHYFIGTCSGSVAVFEYSIL